MCRRVSKLLLEYFLRLTMLVGGRVGVLVGFPVGTFVVGAGVARSVSFSLSPAGSEQRSIQTRLTSAQTSSMSVAS